MTSRVCAPTGYASIASISKQRITNMNKTIAGMASALVALGMSTADAAPLYTVTDIGTLGGTTLAMALNDTGQVVGSSQNGDGQFHAVLSIQGAVQDLGTLGGLNSYAYDLNNAGTVVGGSNLLGGDNLMTHAFSYQNGTMTDIAPPIGAVRSWANGINDAGHVVGTTIDPNYGGDMTVFFVRNGSTQVMKSPLNGMYWADAQAINNLGVAVGSAGGSTGVYVHAFTYDVASGKSKATDISMPEQWYSNPSDINDHNIVVGAMEMGSSAPHAFMYTNGVYMDLGTGDRQFSQATAINEAGQIVGYVYDQGLENSRAFLYEKGSMTYLDTLIDPSLALTFANSYDINEQGQIVANASNGHAYLLTPVPEISTQLMLIVGLAGLATRRKK